MPEYYEGIPGVKPPEKQVQDAAHKEHEDKQKTRKDAAERHAKAHEKTGPAERMYGQDRMINQQTAKQGEHSVKRQEPTQAQKDMQAKREAARAEDRKQAKTDYSDKKYSELSKKPPPSSQSR